MRFCADELSERREKRSAANALGLGADVDDDLAAGCAAIERKYLEAEEGMNAVLAAGAALRWEAERIAPEAFVRSGEPDGTGTDGTGTDGTDGTDGSGVAGSNRLRGALLDVFAEASNARDAFTKLTRPKLFFNEGAVGDAMAAAAAEAGVDASFGGIAPAVPMSPPRRSGAAAAVDEEKEKEEEEEEEEKEEEQEKKEEKEEEQEKEEEKEEEEDTETNVDDAAETNVDVAAEAIIDVAAEAIIDDATVANADDDAEANVDGPGAPPPPIAPEPPDSSPGSPLAPTTAPTPAADDADGWLSDVSEAKDDAADAAAWADTSVDQIREESSESPGDKTG